MISVVMESLRCAQLIDTIWPSVGKLAQKQDCAVSPKHAQLKFDKWLCHVKIYAHTL